MTGEQDTGNRARLPLAERARRGLALTVADIMRLEFVGLLPHEGQQRDDYRRWQRLIEHDIHFEALPVRFETEDDGLPVPEFARREDFLAWWWKNDSECLPADEFIARPDYLAWRRKQASVASIFD